jgi:uncharacterized protein YgbK (DUF1537 family)
MLLGCIADDFTGASDVALMLAKGGMQTVQFIGVPKTAAPKTCEAGVVALKSRSIAPAEAVRQSLEALDWLQEQGCSQILFKYCSTFDSTPQGNIGPVGEALAQRLGARGVVVCPAFPATGRTIYQGHLFVGDKLLSESGMERHPLNPMTDPDLRRWLRLQTREPVGHLPVATIRKGVEAVRLALAEMAVMGTTFVVTDAVADDDLVVVGTACAEAPLITGGSGIALGLPGNFERQGRLARGEAAFRGQDGPAAILAGSCSQATLGQIALHVRHHPSLAIDTDAVMSGATDAATLADFILKHADDEPIVYSSADPSGVSRAQEKHGREAVAHRLDALFAQTARRLVDSGVKRLVVAGGETSGAVVSALDVGALAIGPEIDPGVPALLVQSGPPVALALKSGNFGAPDFFSKALRVLAA